MGDEAEKMAELEREQEAKLKAKVRRCGELQLRGARTGLKLCS